jgi:dipeptidyl aminopeptidase/acylaminoacyl peptidase
MRVVKFQLWRITMVFASSAVAGFTASNSYAAHPLTIDDQLKIETIGRGEADPTGQLFVWEQSPPYNRLQDYSYDMAGTWEGAYRLMSLSIKMPGAVARPLFPPDPKRIYKLDSFSPDGRFVAFYSSKDGKIKVGTFDTRTKKVRYFDHVPFIAFDYERKLQATWVSATSFVYTAYLPNAQPYPVLRRSYGRAMWAAWNKTWAGKSPSVTTVISTAGPIAADFKPGQLILADAETGRERMLSEGRYDTLTVSHDGRFLAGLREAIKPQPDPSKPDLDWASNRSQLTLFDLKTGRLASVAASGLDVFPHSLAWAPHDDRLAFFGWNVGDKVQSGIFRAVDAQTGTIIPYPHIGLDLASRRERGQAQQPESVIWIGDKLAMFARENAAGDLKPHFTYSEMAGLGVGSVGKANWFLVDQFGAHQNLTSNFKSISPIALNADGHSLTVLADKGVWRLSAESPPVNVGEAANHPLALVGGTPHWQPDLTPNLTLSALTSQDVVYATDFLDETSGRLIEVPTPTDTPIVIASSAISHKLLIRRHDNTSDVLEVEDEAGHTSVVAKLNVQLSDVIHTHWSSINYSVQTPSGLQRVSACLLLPANYQSGQRYPVIVDVYPSTNGRFCSNPVLIANREMGISGVIDYSHLLAAHGYIVFKANTERKFIQKPQGPIWAMPEVIEQGVKALISQGLADPKRLGLFGWSQGGVSSLWVASKTNIFKAVVSMNGWSAHYTEFFGSSFAQRFEPSDFPYGGDARGFMATTGTEFGIGKSPEQAPDIYTSNSPLLRADDMNAPTLLIHSDMDGFSMTEYEAMFTALYQKRKEAKFLEYWGEGHAPSSPANLRHMWQSIFNWYDKYLAVDGVPEEVSGQPSTPPLLPGGAATN